MKLSCGMYRFNEKWDKKLKRLISDAEVVIIKKHHITFKLESKRTKVKSFIFWTKEIVSHDLYEVWLSNKNHAYGYLYSFNKKNLPDYLQYRASKETMGDLFSLENKLRFPDSERAYS